MALAVACPGGWRVPCAINSAMAFVLSGEMLLWEAVSNKELGEVKRLLAKGADPNMLCPDAFVNLHHTEKMRAGQTRDTGRALLHHAAWAGDLEVFKAIVDAGGDIDRKRNTVRSLPALLRSDCNILPAPPYRAQAALTALRARRSGGRMAA